MALCFSLLALPLAVSLWGDGWSAGGLHLWLVAFGALLSLAFLVDRHRMGWLHPVSLTVFFTVIALMRRFPAYVQGLSEHTSPMLWGRELSAVLEAEVLFELVAFCAYLAGFILIRRLTPLRIRTIGRAWVPRVAIAVSLTGLLIAVVLVSAQEDGIWGRIALFHTGGGRSEGLSGQHYIIALAGAGIPACLLWLSAQPRALRDWRFLGCSTLALSSSYLAGGGRSTIVIALLLGIMVVMIRERRLLLGPVAIVFLVGLGILAGLGTLGERIGQQGVAEVSREGIAPADFWDIGRAVEEASRRATAGSGSLPIYAAVPDRVGWLNGASYAAVLTSPVPRALWHDKPGLASGRVGRQFFGGSAGKPPGSVAEAYWNFGVSGIVVVHFLFGAFHRWLMSTMLHNYSDWGMRVAYVVAVLYFKQPTSNGAVQMTIMVALVWGLYEVVKRASPRRFDSPLSTGARS